MLSSSPWYGGDDSLFFEYLILGIDGGIAYCATTGPPGYYNDGTYGHLGGHWYWWVDD